MGHPKAHASYSRSVLHSPLWERHAGGSLAGEQIADLAICMTTGKMQWQPVILERRLARVHAILEAVEGPGRAPDSLRILRPCDGVGWPTGV